MKYLVNISKRRAFWSLNKDIFKDYYSDNQYSVSIKKGVSVLALTKYHKGNKLNTPYLEKINTPGDDEVELKDEEFFDNEDEVAEAFRIDTNIFDFETPMCKAFKEFNYLLQIDPDLLLKTLRDSKLIKNISMIGYMTRTEMYHGLMRNHRLTLEFGLNPYRLSIIINPSIIKHDIRNGQHVIGKMMDIVMEETYLELT
nr:hypothetical protein [Tanacetum cinerariifolium]